MANKEFLAALKKNKSFKTRFNKSRKAKRGGDFSAPEIDDGNYVVRVGAAVKVAGGKPVAEFRWTVTRGDFKGTSHRHTVWLENDDKEREQQNWDDLSVRLQALGVDMDGFEITDLPEVLEEINEDKPLVRAKIENWSSKSGNSGLNCYFNELLDADEDDDEEDEAEAEETEEDIDAEAEDEEEDED